MLNQASAALCAGRVSCALRSMHETPCSNSNVNRAGDDFDALAQRMDEAATQGAFATNGSSVVPLRVAVD